ncbi:MAG: hypothetical protein IJS88_00540 [Alphaproteobacteria bacterium]|nr:hypothetical protein [Alphaproteobacteria bacterium]
MAKNDKKYPKSAEETTPDVISAPEKIIDSPLTKALQPEPHKPPHPTEHPHKKHHGWRKFILLIILLLAGAVGYLTVQLKQTEKINSAALQKLQTAYDEKLSAVNSRIFHLDQEIIGLKNRPIVEHAAGISENQLNQKLAALRSELEHRFGNSNEESTSAENTEEKSTASAPTPTQTSAATVTAPKNDKIAHELLLASGAIIVRDLAEQGVNFAYEAEVLQILARDNELAERNVEIVRDFANTGVTGKHKLIRNFDKIFAELGTADIKTPTPNESEFPTQEKWYQQVWKWIKKQITAQKQPQKPIFTPQEDEVLHLVHEGRIKDALEAINLSEKYAKINSEPLVQWKQQAERYLTFDSAVNALIVNALANIRLKEMEH